MGLEITGIKALSLHHDISTVTGEEVVLFTLLSRRLSARRRRSRNVGRSRVEGGGREMRNVFTGESRKEVPIVWIAAPLRAIWLAML